MWPGPIPSIGSLLGPADTSTGESPEVPVAVVAARAAGAVEPSVHPRFRQALAALLPQGYAWPRDPGSVWMRVIDGLAGAFADHHAWVRQTVREWQPHRTHTRLAEWEAATGLPDACFGVDQSFADRQDRVLARLRGVSAEYADSSPAAPQGLVDLCASLGYTAVVLPHLPRRFGRDRRGSRYGANNGKVVLQIAVASVPKRFGVDRFGARYVKRPPTLSQLACALEPRVPARYALSIIIV